MCRYFSSIQNLHTNKREANPEAAADFAENRRRAVEHLRFCIELCEIQEKAGRHYLLENPASASSWQEACVVDFVANSAGALLCTGHQCMFGLTSRGDDGVDRAAAKLTRWLTNSPCLAEALEVKCDGSHQHQPLMG